MNDDKDDSALVDSFFLPGGLFATENNNDNSNNDIKNDNIDDDDNDNDDKHHQTLLRHSISASAAETANRNPLSPVPSNPWETNTTTTTTTVQVTESTVLEEQFMSSPLSLTNTNSDVHRIDLRNDNDDGGDNRVVDVDVDVDVDLYGQQFQHRQGEGAVGASIENSLFYHKQEVMFDSDNDNDNNDIKDKKSIRPPPGFQNESTNIDYSDNTNVTNKDKTQKATNNNQIYNNNNKNTTIGSSTTSDNNKSSSRLRTTNNLHDPIIKRPIIRRCQKTIPKSVERLKSVENSSEIRALIIDNNDFTTSTTQQQQQQQQQQINKSHNTILSHLNDNDDSSDATPATYSVPEELMSPITIGTKESSTSSCKLIDLEDDYDDDDDDDDDDDQHEEEDTTIDNDIPMSICGSLAGESNASSLSTSSDVDNPDIISHTTSDNNPRHNEGVGYDTDQAHVSQIVDVMGSSSSDGKEIIGDDNDDDDGQSISPTISIDVSFEGQKQTSIPVCPPPDQPNNKKCHHRAADRIIHSSWQRLIVFLRSIAQYLSKATSDGINLILLGIRSSSFFLTVRKVYEISSQQITSLSQEFHKISIWLKDVEEVFKVLTIQLLKMSLKIFETIAKAIMIAGSFAILMWKCSVLEALEEFNVTICYLVFYLMPMMCSLLMDWINLPHWTPHMITLLTVFPLCHQVKAGTLHQNDVSIYYLIGKLYTTALSTILPASTNNTLSSKDITSEVDSSTEIITQQDSTQQQQQQQQQRQQDDVTRPRDEQICCHILRVLRFVLPVLFLADGFSSQFGTIIGVSGSSRLTTAFMMSLIRKNILSSPLGVISWSIQIMIATYYNSWDQIDYAILVIGLSSIRLIRYLEIIQRNKRIRQEK